MEENKETNLTQKQLLFVKHYVASLNATKAATEAGYSKKTARTQGSVLLTNPNIQKEIDSELNDIHLKQKRLLMRAADSAIKALIETVEKGKGLARVNAANSILDRAGHKAVDKFQGDLNANVKGDVNVTHDSGAKPALLSKLLCKFSKGTDSKDNSDAQ
jgi:Phage terminase, small subunit